jgi:RND family efflux transporter MFP subunit
LSSQLLRWAPIGVLVIGALAAWGLAAGRPANDPAVSSPALPRVPVVKMIPRPVRVRVRAHGSVEPRSEIELVAEVAGRVTAVSSSLDVGRFFAEGDVLVEIDRADAELQVEGARARVLRLQSEVRRTLAQLERLQALASRDISSASQLEDSQHLHQIARAERREARAALGRAERDLERTRVHAPFAGRVRDKHVDVGQFVSRGTPLARVHAVDYAEIRLPVPSSDLAFLELPNANGSAPGARVVLRATYAGKPSTWEARLVRSEGEFEQRSRMLHLVARVDDPYDLNEERGGSPLPVGLFVEAEIEGRTFDDVFVLPRGALRTPTQVAVVDDEGRVQARRVDVLRIEGERILVRSGLRAGDRVVVAAAGTVDGTMVKAVPTSSTAAPLSLAGKRP